MAKVNLTDTVKIITANKAKYRNRASSVAETAGVEVSIGWLDTGDMYITLSSK